jgi:hypothetical protein
VGPSTWVVDAQVSQHGATQLKAQGRAFLLDEVAEGEPVALKGDPDAASPTLDWVLLPTELEQASSRRNSADSDA